MSWTVHSFCCRTVPPFNRRHRRRPSLTARQTARPGIRCGGEEPRPEMAGGGGHVTTQWPGR
jgi:hypothetical protein